MCTTKGENSMGDFGFNPSWMKKDDVARKNYVEITPEEQAAIDKANAETKAALEKEALTQGLSGNNKKDLDKGISIQKQDTIRTNTGNGVIKVTHPDGSVEFELDYAKGYDGSPQLFAEGTKVTVLNAPEEPKKGFWQKLGDVIANVNDWGNRVTGGQIRGLGRGVATMGVVAGSATLASAATGAAAATGAVKVGGGVLAATSLASCNKMEIPEPPGAHVSVSNKDMADYIVNYLNDPNNEQGFIPETPDGVDFKYGYDYNSQNDIVRPYIDFGNGLKLYINTNPLQDLTVDNVVDYIDIIGDELITNDGVQYDFTAEGNKANVNFGNGLIHTVGDDVTLNENGTTARLYSILDKVGFAQPAQSSEIVMDLSANEGSYGNGVPGFAMGIVTPANLKDITSGNPVIKGNIGTYNFHGKAEKADAGEFTLEANGQTKSNSAGGIHIVNNNGDEIYMQYEEGFDLQSVWDEPGQNLWDGTIVYVKEKGSDVFKERYILSKFDESNTDIGLIDRSENGTTLQHYPSDIITFDTQGAIDADNYYNEKQDNLHEAHVTADSNYRYMNQWHFGADAEVNIKQ